MAKPAVCFGIGLEQEGQEEEKLRTVLERVKAAAAPLPQRLAELRNAVEREARDLQRREAGQPLTAVTLNHTQPFVQALRARCWPHRG